MSEEIKQTKGQETKEWILKCSRELMYENGYRATTARKIAEKADINLGLFNYYFDGKNEIGNTVYYGWRNSLEKKMHELIPDFSDIDSFIFSSATELYLCLNDPHVGRFYCDISEEPLIFNKARSYIIDTFTKYSKINDIPDYAVFAGLSITSIKPAMVRYSLEHDISNIDDCLIYYMKQQLHYFGLPEKSAVKYLNRLKKYDIYVENDFSPVFKLKGTFTV